MSAWYNDSEPYVVDWMRNLIGAGCIAPGVVDGRSIKEVAAADVRSARQAHFFAGIGVWSYALRLAGWPDDVEVWTGSCPCQPFSAAGRKRGTDDERHLWPEWFRLISECRPAVILGEQVGSPDGLKWLDAVSSDLEGAGYAFGAADLCAASVGAPHQRQRLFFVAYAAESGWRPRWGSGLASDGGAKARLEPRRLREARDVADAHGLAGDEGRVLRAGGDRRGDEEPRPRLGGGGRALELAHANGERLEGGLHLRLRGPRADLLEALRHSQAGGLGHANGVGGARHAGASAAAQAAGRGERNAHRALDDGALASSATGVLGDARCEGLEVELGDGGAPRDESSGDAGQAAVGAGTPAGATRGFWRDAEWIYCRDGKWRPTGSELIALADGSATGVGSVRTERRAIWPLSTGEVSRVGRIKGYGNAIVAPLAATFIRAFMDVVAVQ